MSPAYSPRGVSRAAFRTAAGDGTAAGEAKDTRNCGFGPGDNL